MYEAQSNNILNINETPKKNKKYFSNVFSSMAKPKRGKLYQKLQVGLNLLNDEVKLLNGYDNKDNFVRKKNYRINTLNNDNKKRRFNLRDSVLLLKKKNLRISNALNAINNNLTKKDNINDSQNENNGKNKNYNNSDISKFLIYKTEVDNKYPYLMKGKKMH